MVLGMVRALAESRAHLAELSAANAALRRATAELEASRGALAASEARLRLALDAARMATWDWDFIGDTTWGSPGREALYGRPPGSLRTRADVLGAVHPEDRAMAADTILRAMMRAPGEDEFDSVEFRVLDPDGSVRWLRSQGRVTVRDRATGQAQNAAGVTFDVTARRTAERAAARALAELRAVYDSAPAGLALLDRSGAVMNLNAQMAAMLDVPQPSPAGMPLDALLPGGLHEAIRNAHGRVLATGAAVTGIEAVCGAASPAGGLRHWEARLQPVLADQPEGGVLAVTLMLEDVTDRRRAEAKRDLLSREVDHRARNALSVVQAAVRLTRADTAAAFARAVEGRVAAVARAQAMLADGHWSGAGLRPLAEAALAPFAQAGAAARVRFSGPEVVLAATAVQPLSMALHELATNAVKYGALSTADGGIDLGWTLDAPSGLLRLRWSEAGGPPLAGVPSRRGFGSRVLEGTIRDQLGGQVEMDWSGSGLVCGIDLPVGRAVAA